MRRGRRGPKLPSRNAVRNHLAGLDALYRPAAEAERIIDEFRDGATLGELERKYPERDVSVILRRYEGAPEGER